MTQQAKDWWRIAERIVTYIMIGAIGFVGSELLDHRDAITKINATRFTGEDGIDMMDRIVELREDHNKSISAIQVALAKLPLEVPPQWFLEKVDSLEDRIEVLEKR